MSALNARCSPRWSLQGRPLCIHWRGPRASNLDFSWRNQNSSQELPTQISRQIDTLHLSDRSATLGHSHLTLAILKVVVSWPVHRAASLSPGARIRSGPPFASSVFQLVRNDDLAGGEGGINFRQSQREPYSRRLNSVLVRTGIDEA